MTERNRDLGEQRFDRKAQLVEDQTGATLSQRNVSSGGIVAFA
jgi:hypothetical protein